MARTVLNVRLGGESTPGTGAVSSYTVPPGKIAVVAVHEGPGAGSGALTINNITGPTGPSFKPLVLAGGDVVTVESGTGSTFLTGFLYDA